MRRRPFGLVLAVLVSLGAVVIGAFFVRGMVQSYGARSSAASGMQKLSFQPVADEAGNVQPVLMDLNGTDYNWSVVAPKYSLIILNAWDYPWIREIKAANPGVKVFEYKDLASSRPSACAQSHDSQVQSGLPTGVDFCWASKYHPGWFLKNSSGQLLQYNGYPRVYEMNYGLPAYEQTWAANVISDLKAHGWDGVEADNALTTNGYGMSPTYPTDRAVQAGMTAMIKVVGPAIKNAGKDFLPNVGGDLKYPSIWSSWLPYTTGEMQEFTFSWDTQIDKNVADWKIFEGEVQACAVRHDNCMFHAGDYERQQAAPVNFYMASYLLYADGSSTLGPGDMWYQNYPALYQKLGVAEDGASQISPGVWTRRFTGGSVTVNLNTFTATISA